MPDLIFRILESPNTSPPTAVLLCMTSFTNICSLQETSDSINEDQRGGRSGSGSATSKHSKLLKKGKKRLTSIFKSDDPLPEGFTKKDVEFLIGKCSRSEKCSIS